MCRTRSVSPLFLICDEWTTEEGDATNSIGVSADFFLPLTSDGGQRSSVDDVRFVLQTSLTGSEKNFPGETDDCSVGLLARCAK